MDESRNLRAKLANGEQLFAPGAHSPLAAKVIEHHGSDGVYISGFGTEASLLARPDMGFLSKNEMLLQANHVEDAVDVPIICDMEQGYGEPHEIERNIKQFEKTGISAVHIDDEQRPMKCPFIPGLPPGEVIDEARMVNKIKAAVDGRDDPDFLIIARCDMVVTSEIEDEYDVSVPDEKKDEYLQRLQIYEEAGADMIFAGESTQQEYEEVVSTVDVPVLGIVNPWVDLTVDEVFDAGCSVVISAVPVMFGAIKGMQRHLELFAESRDLQEVHETMVSSDEFWDLIDIDKYSERYKTDFIEAMSD